MTIIWLIVGVALVCWGSDYFIKGVLDIGRRLHWSEFISGLIIVGFGTSVPEIAISIYAAFTAHGAILIGNIVGSNITNASLVLGLGLLIRPITAMNYFNLSNVASFTVATLLLILGIFLGYFSRWLGIVMLLTAVLSVWLMTKHHASHDPQAVSSERIAPWYISVFKSLVGLVLLLISSDLIVKNAVALATSWHIDQSIIAMTIIAIGTSLPEIVLSIIASFRGYSDLVVGNIIGSNISNVLLAIGLPALISPFATTKINWFATCGLIVSSLLFLIVIGLSMLRKRWVGLVLILFYAVVYGLAWLY